MSSLTLNFDHISPAAISREIAVCFRRRPVATPKPLSSWSTEGSSCDTKSFLDMEETETPLFMRVPLRRLPRSRRVCSLRSRSAPRSLVEAERMRRAVGRTVLGLMFAAEGACSLPQERVDELYASIRTNETFARTIGTRPSFSTGK